MKLHIRKHRVLKLSRVRRLHTQENAFFKSLINYCWRPTAVFANCIHFFVLSYHRLRTPNEGIKQRNLKNSGQYGRQNMFRLYFKIWEWELVFGTAAKTISSPGVRSPWFLLSSLSFVCRNQGTQISSSQKTKKTTTFDLQL